MSFAHAAGTYQSGDQGPEVAAIQTQLNNLGYKAGNVDGDFGELTTNAVKAFQKARGIEADGIVSAETYRALIGREMPVSRGDGSTSGLRRVVQTALRYVGVPYAFGGTTPNGFDCSGFARFVFAQIGIYLPRMADEQFAIGRTVSYQNLQPGDMVYFSTYTSGPSHSGIYIGEGKFISATTSRGVAIDSLDSSYWGPRYVGARRVM
ncbi:MAG TPA: NlpC/P60 family protein [Methylomusa anaerophila]|uniref:C40 family peptidase n=1 Tax=Methylomusa anaerophila TaxID=1930071 RepID=UPI001E499BD9|nr:NlpC/P60 family protein [Methylomusa anaerophila]HML87394.1 NlpC/P60 family protein [Methylomusa anaerophila]